ncbi:hypothetical protein [Rhizobium phage RHEph12]|nr:hypothetical protein [Rhizobium phage RHEph12]
MKIRYTAISYTGVEEEIELPLYLRINDDGNINIGSKWRYVFKKVYKVDGYMRADVFFHEATANFGVVDGFSVDMTYDQAKLEKEFGKAERLTEDEYLQALAMSLGRLRLNGFDMEVDEINTRRDQNRRHLARHITERLK